MKIGTKICLTLGAVASVGLLYAAGVMASSAEQEEPASEVETVTLTYEGEEISIDESADDMFSHQAHVIEMEFECDSCHSDLFEMEKGAAAGAGDYTMASLEEGKYCGACHNDDDASGVKESETCVTCHGSNMEQPKVIVFNEPVRSVIFGHAEHVEMGMECSSCHNHLFKTKLGNAEERPGEFTMEALYAGKYCGACHNGDDAFASDTKCTTCHIGVRGAERMFGEPKAESGGHH